MSVHSLAATTGSAEDIRADYLKLLVTQLQNQNPLEPMSNSDMTSQLAALSQLEQMENMSNSFAKVLEAEQFSQAGVMLGKDVVMRTEDGEDFEAGTVARVDILEGTPQLVVDVVREAVVDGELTHVIARRVIGFNEVLSIKETPPPPQAEPDDGGQDTDEQDQ